MRFEVPQFIEIEDKIFGPLTWRQFLYLGGGVGAAVVMFLRLPFVLFVVLGVPLAMLAGALAFYSVNSRPFSYYLEAVMGYLSGHRLYLWRKEEATYTNDTPDSNSPYPQEARKRNAGGLASLARRLELQAIEKKN